MFIKQAIKEICLSPVLACRGSAADNRIALTFDDGPHPVYTRQVLDVLEENQVRATFFLLGDNIAKHPDITESLRMAGHELANHSMSHPEFRELSYRQLEKEIIQTYNIKDKKGNYFLNSRYFRPPKGALSFKLLVYSLLNEVNMVLWSSDPKDYKAESPDMIVSYFRVNPPKAGDIILLHDKTPYIAEALNEILDIIRSRDLQPVTVSNLLAAI